MESRKQRALTWTAVLVLWCAGCATVEKAPADTRLEEAQRAFDESKKLEGAGSFEKAVPLAEHALALREAVLGGSHLKVAEALFLRGTLQLDRRDFTHAEAPIKRALAIREAALGPNHPDVAASLNDLAVVSRNRGDYAQAEALSKRALTIREAAFGPNHPDVASSLGNLSNIYSAQGLYGQAVPLLERALVIREAVLGPVHPDVATSLNNLAALYDEQGQYAQAEPLYERAIAIRQAALGPSHPLTGSALNNLGTLYMAQGLYSRAEPLIERGLAIREAALGPNHPDVASTLNNLASLSRKQGQYARCEPLYQRALAIREAAFGPNHPLVATSLNNLGIFYGSRGDYARAEPLLLRARAIREKALGPKHPLVASSLKNLGELYTEQGQYALAEPLLERSLALVEASLGPNHPDVAYSLENLGEFYTDQGQYARAEPLLERALAIREAAFGPKHPYVATSLDLLAAVRFAQQRFTQATALFDRALAISEAHLRLQALTLSEVHLGNLLQLLRRDEERLYSLARARPEDPQVQRLALAATLLLKGRSVEELARTSRTIYRGLSAEDQHAFERLRALRTQLAEVSLAGPGKQTPEDYQRRLAELSAQGDALETDLAQRSAPLRALTALPTPAQIVDRVAQALPPDSALIEFVAYEDRPLVSTPGIPEAQQTREPRYLALVLFPDGRIRVADLGPAAPMDQAIHQLNGTLAHRAATYRPDAQALYRLAFQPLRPLLGKTRRLYLATDGQLSLTSFAALYDGKQFLVDSFHLGYLASGKDLLSHPESATPARSVVVLADPSFDADLAAPAPGEVLASTERSAPLEEFFSTRSAELANQPWPPLPGTREEAQAIQRLLPQAQLLLGADASKQALLRLPAPGVLHIATHGFFLDDPAAPKNTRAVGQFGEVADAGPRQLSLDPLLRSGLVLAGARATAHPPHPEDSLVTALELSGMDLWGTQLVVLSACDTGRGDVRPGQGVYGLRRALGVAGAQTVVMSLWKVNDETTRTLMEDYYRRLLAGQRRADALDEAMRALRNKQPHPYYWAPFVAIGLNEPLHDVAPQGSPQATGH